ncbi:rifin [Plasmodium falciparum IGH-CR14]|uniref:Rifin n=1 Tax=Plasmodium falciparum IGH-CR14 TaxID=580059 RepID=A0A0L1I8P7_PLAFA|nr:rifin [Plasmodium falciparum IGH-CR14]
MKVHYINILLFALPLNILVGSPHKNPSITPNHPSNTRLLCDCELYAPSNYDNDPEMKEVMEIFDRQTSERFHEYDERMKTTRQKCKDKCDEAIQKIILKDKMEKQMAQQLTTLETKIDTNDIPTCICEKSLTEKAEKVCLKCTQNLGGIVAPSSGVLGGIAELGLNAWKTTEITAAIAAAKQAGAAMGKAAGDAAGATEVIKLMKTTFYINELNGKLLESVFTAQNYTNFPNLPHVIYKQYKTTCDLFAINTSSDPICKIAGPFKFIAEPGQEKVSEVAVIEAKVTEIFTKATDVAATETTNVTTTQTTILETAKKGAIETTCMGYHTTIIVSIIAILVIVLVMVIIYLILRYRRKKKMKKKLHYIKLLKE